MTEKQNWLPHQILWLKAAMELPRWERLGAFDDIASLSGRSFAACRAKAYAMHARALATWAAAARPVTAEKGYGAKPAWKLNAPSRAMLMAGRASCRNRATKV